MNERFIVIGRWTYFPFGCASSCNVDIVAVVFHFSDKSLRNGRFMPPTNHFKVHFTSQHEDLAMTTTILEPLNVGTWLYANMWKTSQKLQFIPKSRGSSKHVGNPSCFCPSSLRFWCKKTRTTQRSKLLVALIPSLDWGISWAWMFGTILGMKLINTQIYIYIYYIYMYIYIYKKFDFPWGFLFKPVFLGVFAGEIPWNPIKCPINAHEIPVNSCSIPLNLHKSP